MTIIPWLQLEEQERIDYIHGLIYAFFPNIERNAAGIMIDIGLADGTAARDSGMKIDKREVAARDAQFVWDTCRQQNIGASPALLARLKRVDE